MASNWSVRWSELIPFLPFLSAVLHHQSWLTSINRAMAAAILQVWSGAAAIVSTMWTYCAALSWVSHLCAYVKTYNPTLWLQTHGLGGGRKCHFPPLIINIHKDVSSHVLCIVRARRNMRFISTYNRAEDESKSSVKKHAQHISRGCCGQCRGARLLTCLA